MLSDTSKYAEQAQIFLILNQVDKNIKIQATHYKVKCIFERSEVPKAKKLVSIEVWKMVLWSEVSFFTIVLINGWVVQL